ncbi:MAG: hypothetical protein J6Q42_00805 [Clostridia bacterium]|jgi:UDP-glucose 4-epimerase|nr:hypothetical protein [Clostridia bacterium]
MSILITGGYGYIGSYTCLDLFVSGDDMVMLDNFYNSDPKEDCTAFSRKSN